MNKNKVTGCSADLRKIVRAEIRAALADFGPILARLAAADTVHTTELPETVFRHAVDEGLIARRLMDGASKES
jgi:hypothetical protein